MKMKSIAAIVAAMAVSAVSVMSMSASAEMKDSYRFQLGGQFGIYQDWNGNSGNTVTVDHDGTYTITWAVSEATETNEEDLTLALDSDVNIYDYATTEGSTGLSEGNIKITIDSVTVDGNALAYTQSADAARAGDDGSSLRVNLRNRFASPVITDLEANWSIESELAVTFTVEGLFPVVEATTEAPEATTEASADGTTTAAGSTTTAAGSTTTAAGSTTTAATTTNAATGDTGIAVAVAALAVAGGMVLVSRKNK